MFIHVIFVLTFFVLFVFVFVFVFFCFVFCCCCLFVYLFVSCRKFLCFFGFFLEFNNCVCKFDKNKNKNLLKKKKKNLRHLQKPVSDIQDDQAYSEPRHSQNNFFKHFQGYLWIFRDTDAYSATPRDYYFCRMLNSKCFTVF